MKLTELHINNYKSIKHELIIKLDDNNMITFIGKNGSGKTNILEAIKSSINIQNSNFRRQTLSSEYKLKFTKDEINRYHDFLNVNEDNNEVLITRNNIENKRDDIVTRIYSKTLESISSEFSNRLKEEFNIYKKKSDEYLNKLKFILEQYDNLYNVHLTEKNKLNELTLSGFEWIEKQYTMNLEELKKIVMLYGSKDGLTFSNIIYDRYYFYDMKFFQLPTMDEDKIKINPIIAKSLGLSEGKLEEANKKVRDELKLINKSLEDDYHKINKAVENINYLIQKIKSIFDISYDEVIEKEGKANEKYNSLVKALNTQLLKKCYFIDNESSLLFYNDKDNRTYESKREYLNYENPILDSIKSFLTEKNYLDEKNNLNDISEENLNLIEESINKDFLGAIISDDNKDGVKKYFVKLKKINGHTDFKFYIEEKTGDIVDINNTSLGRRWLLTYQFVKQLIKSGDCLLIDEPAAFLHPEMQIEFRNELKELSKKGIYVFMTTHSPYMIDDNWNNVYNVKYSEKGTEVNKLNTKDDKLKLLKEELGVLKTSDIYFNLSKKLLLVEGKADKECIEKFASLLGYDLSNYHIIVTNGSSIILLTNLCIEEELNFISLFDADTKDKPCGWLNREYGYKEYLDNIYKNPKCIFTKEMNDYKSIEAYFSKEDQEKYFKKFKRRDKDGNIIKEEFKVCSDKVKSGINFSQETKDNFEELLKQLELKKTKIEKIDK